MFSPLFSCKKNTRNVLENLHIHFFFFFLQNITWSLLSKCIKQAKLNHLADQLWPAGRIFGTPGLCRHFVRCNLYPKSCDVGVPSAECEWCLWNQTPWSSTTKEVRGIISSSLSRLVFLVVASWLKAWFFLKVKRLSTIATVTPAQWGKEFTLRK